MFSVISTEVERSQSEYKVLTPSSPRWLHRLPEGSQEYSKYKTRPYTKNKCTSQNSKTNLTSSTINGPPSPSRGRQELTYTSSVISNRQEWLTYYFYSIVFRCRIGEACIRAKEILRHALVMTRGTHFTPKTLSKTTKINKNNPLKIP